MHPDSRNSSDELSGARVLSNKESQWFRLSVKTIAILMIPYVLEFAVRDQEFVISGEGSVWLFDSTRYEPSYAPYAPFVLMGAALFLISPSIYFNHRSFSRPDEQDIRFLVAAAFLSALLLLLFILTIISTVDVRFVPPLAVIENEFSFLSRVTGFSLLVLVCFPAFHHTLPLPMNGKGHLKSPATKIWFAVFLLPSGIGYLDASSSSFIWKSFFFGGDLWGVSIQQIADIGPLTPHTTQRVLINLGPGLTLLSIITLSILVLFSYFTLLHLRRRASFLKVILFGILWFAAQLLLDINYMITNPVSGYVYLSFPLPLGILYGIHLMRKTEPILGPDTSRATQLTELGRDEVRIPFSLRFSSIFRSRPKSTSYDKDIIEEEQDSQ